jgi:hypothetical protein
VVAGVVGGLGLINLPVLLAGPSTHSSVFSDRVILLVQAISVFTCQFVILTAIFVPKFRLLRPTQQGQVELATPPNSSAFATNAAPLAQSMKTVRNRSSVVDLCSVLCGVVCCKSLVTDTSAISRPPVANQFDFTSSGSSHDRHYLREKIANLKDTIRRKDDAIQNLTNNLLYNSDAFKLYLERYVSQTILRRHEGYKPH